MKTDTQTTRALWVDTMHKIAFPIVSAAADNRLREVLPLSKKEKKRGVAYLEAIGRTIAGLAPWLELNEKQINNEKERELQSTYRILCRKMMANATNPNAKDYCVWNKNGTYLLADQPIVDAAYFASAILKAPKQLWELQDDVTKNNILKAFDLVLLMKPNSNNWLLFTATIETCRYVLTGTADAMRIEYALTKHYEWYKGDGTFGDGDTYYWDYYNSYVIQPMLEEVSRLTKPLMGIYYLPQRRRFTLSLKRYCEIQERMIAPDGSYPFLGRSITYRMAAFHALAHAAYREMLPKSLPPAQVRCALDKVIHKAMSASTLFDNSGLLTKGLYGEQPSLANSYTNLGSLYICLTVFLPLGLSAKNKFWTGKDQRTTWEKAWSGEDMEPDEGLEHRRKTR